MRTNDMVQARYNPGLKAVVGFIQPQSYARSIVSMAISGPSGSALKIYRGYAPLDFNLMSSVYPASNRSWDAGTSGSLVVGAGEAVTFAWTGGAAVTGATATATVTSEVG